jgi:two-component system, sensor histidine kinase PdtaS
VDLFTLTQPLRRRAWLAYALAILLPLAALGVRFLIGPVLSGSPFLTFVPAVLLVAYVGGWGAGLFCATVSGLLASFYSIQPFAAFEFETPDDWIPIVFYAGISLVIIALVDAMNRAHARL